MKGAHLTIFLFMLAITSLMAQSESVNISAWIEVVDLPTTKKIEIRGMIKNESDQELNLYQKMDLTKSGRSGTAKHQQSGSFTLGPNRTKILGRSSFYKSNTDNYKVIFQIHNDLGAIFTDSLYYPEAPVIAQKEIPKKIIPSTPAKQEKTEVAVNPPAKTTVPNKIEKTTPTNNKPIIVQKEMPIKSMPSTPAKQEKTEVAINPPTKTTVPNKTEKTTPTNNKPIIVQKEMPIKSIPSTPAKQEKTEVAINPPTKTTVPNKTEKTTPTNNKNKSITSTRRSKTAVPVDVLEIDGLIIDETRSKIARDFYDLFYKKWIAPKGAKNFSIYIREEPSRGRGAQVSLTLNDQKIFQNFVPPRYDALENVVNFAIRATRARLSAKSKINDQLKEEDQMGSGI